MSEDINSVTIVGRLTRDAELSYTNSGSAVTKGSIAVNRSKKVGENWEEEASFFNFELWGRRGESLNQYLQQGTRIAITGSLRQDRWEKDGQKHNRVYIHCESIQLLGGNQNNSQGGNNSYNNQGNNSYQSNNNNRSGGNNSYNTEGNNQRNNNQSNNRQANNKPDYSDTRNNGRPTGNNHNNYPSGNQGGNGNFEDDIPF